MMKSLLVAATVMTLSTASQSVWAAGAANGEAGSGQTESSATQARQSPLTADDRAFLNYVAEDNQAEIALCLMAEKQSQAPSVKAFSRLMVNDHVQVESQLAALINGIGIEVPNGVGKDGAEKLDKLKDLQGTGFDRPFMEAQVSDHEHDIGKYDAEIKSTQNSGLRNFASETVEILKQHLALAKAVLSGLSDQSSRVSAPDGLRPVDRKPTASSAR